MLQHLLWGITFVTLWLTLVWLNFLYMDKPKKRLTKYPKITFGIPAYNEARTILKTVKSLLNADYPLKKKEILVVDDGSTDGTADIVRQYVNEHPGIPVKVITKKNGGKASALIIALDRAKGEYFAVVDADSRISKGSIKKSLLNFSDENIGAVISRVRVDNPRNFLQRLQRFEYIMSSMTRKIMCNFGTLSITPGVLSLYKTKILHEIGGFTKDENNLTEDLEIAMRLKYNGYDIRMEHESITYTHVPHTFTKLWRQRIRWARGYIYNHWNYRRMFFSNKHGLFGTFQLPVNVIVVLLLVLNVGIIMFDLIDKLFEFVIRSITIDGYFISKILSYPTLKEFILARNVQEYQMLSWGTSSTAFWACPCTKNSAKPM